MANDAILAEPGPVVSQPVAIPKAPAATLATVEFEKGLGIFKVTQSKGVTSLTLTEALAVFYHVSLARRSTACSRG